MGKGKGRRRRQANYLAAHGGMAALPAPPSASELMALPSKLRRIITLKSSSSQGHDSAISRKQLINSKSQNRSVTRERGKQYEKKQLKKLEDSSREEDSSLKVGDGGSVCLRETSGPKHKKRKREDELLVLSERFKAKPIHKGLNDRKKRYLQEKKKKKKGLMRATTNEQVPTLNQQERVGFGEIVEAPPKLSFPKKQKNAAEERFRQQAIATYREKKNWISRPGSHQPPPLTNMGELLAS